MRLLKRETIVVLIALSSPASAGEGSGLIRAIVPVSDGRIILRVERSKDTPACAAKQVDQFDFDGRTAEGKNMLALLILAANSKKPIIVHGSGACLNAPHDRESIFVLSLEF